MKYLKLFLFLFFLLLISCSPLGIMDQITADVIGNTVIYVDAAAPPGGDGKSWETAYKYLNDAFFKLEAYIHDYNWSPVIHVAEGIYYPGEFEDQWYLDNAMEDAFWAFCVSSHLQLLGGFPSGGGERNAQIYKSVLSGDIDKNDITDEFGVTVNPEDIVGSNAATIMLIQGENDDDALFTTQDTLIDGFIITGSAESLENSSKAAVGVVSSSFFQPTLSNLTFTGNQHSALEINGGEGTNCAPIIDNCVFQKSNRAITISGHSSPRILNSSFINNSENFSGGGAVSISTYEQLAGLPDNDYFQDIEVLFLNCIFEGNGATSSGGGAVNIMGGIAGSIDALFANCRFYANFAGDGGSVYIHGFAGKEIEVSFVNNIFIGNTSSGQGGVIYIRYEADLSIINCSMTANQATSEGGSLYAYENSPQVKNSVLWNNSSSGKEIDGYNASPVFYYCNLDGSGGSSSWDYAYGGDGGGNMDSNPLFITQPASGGDWTNQDNNDYGNLKLSTGSPLINSGHNYYLIPDKYDIDSDGDTDEIFPYDVDGNNRISENIVDIGAYEN